MTATIKLPTLTCTRCGYSWFPRSPELPTVCASKACKSPYWNVPRRPKNMKKAAGKIKQ